MQERSLFRSRVSDRFAALRTPVMLGILILVLPLVALQTTVKPPIAMTGARRGNYHLGSGEIKVTIAKLLGCLTDVSQR